MHKAQQWIVRALESLTRKQLNKADWKNWHRSLHLLGFLGCIHGILQRSVAEFCRTWRERAQPDPAVGNPGDDPPDQMELWRLEMAANVRTASAYWAREQSELDLYVFRTFLRPQTHVMHEILRCTAAEWQVEQMHAAISGGSLLRPTLRSPPVVEPPPFQKGFCCAF